MLHIYQYDHKVSKTFEEIQVFRHGLAALLKYDWVPIPLLYPQVIFIAVRLYFCICLISRQFIVRTGAEHKSDVSQNYYFKLINYSDYYSHRYIVN
jgi:hypothetical protein